MIHPVGDHTNTGLAQSVAPTRLGRSERSRTSSSKTQTLTTLLQMATFRSVRKVPDLLQISMVMMMAQGDIG